jgi:hypothetical protein
MLYEINQNQIPNIQRDVGNEGVISQYAPYHVFFVAQNEQRILCFCDGGTNQFIADTSAVVLSSDLSLPDGFSWINGCENGVKDRLIEWASRSVGCLTTHGICMQCGEKDLVALTQTTDNTFVRDIYNKNHLVSTSDFDSILWQMRDRATKFFKKLAGFANV